MWFTGEDPMMRAKWIIVLTNSWQQSFCGQLGNSMALARCLWVKMVSAPGPLLLGCVHHEGVGFLSQMLKQLIHSPAAMELWGRGRRHCVSFSQAHSWTSWLKKWIPLSLLESMGVLNLTHSCSRPQTVAYSPTVSLESNEPRAWGCYF